MKRIKQDELYRNLSGFLRRKGIALQEGTYAQRIRQGCQLLTDAINVTQKGLNRAKGEVDRKLERMREVIQKKTGTRPATAPKATKKTTAGRGKGKARAGGRTPGGAPPKGRRKQPAAAR